MYSAIVIALFLLGVAVFFALIPEMRNILHRLRHRVRPRQVERHVLRAPEEAEPRRARPKLKREPPPQEPEPPPA